MVWPATKLRFEANGCARSEGQTVTNPEPDGSVTVTFNVTATGPESGTGARPRICKLRDSPAPKLNPPRPVRVSIKRVGVTGAYARIALEATAGEIWLGSDAAEATDGTNPAIKPKTTATAPAAERTR